MSPLGQWATPPSRTRHEFAKLPPLHQSPQYTRLIKPGACPAYAGCRFPSRRSLQPLASDINDGDSSRTRTWIPSFRLFLSARHRGPQMHAGDLRGSTIARRASRGRAGSAGHSIRDSASWQQSTSAGNPGWCGGGGSGVVGYGGGGVCAGALHSDYTYPSPYSHESYAQRVFKAGRRGPRPSFPVCRAGSSSRMARASCGRPVPPQGGMQPGPREDLDVDVSEEREIPRREGQVDEPTQLVVVDCGVGADVVAAAFVWTHSTPHSDYAPREGRLKATAPPFTRCHLYCVYSSMLVAQGAQTRPPFRACHTPHPSLGLTLRSLAHAAPVHPAPAIPNTSADNPPARTPTRAALGYALWSTHESETSRSCCTSPRRHAGVNTSNPGRQRGRYTVGQLIPARHVTLAPEVRGQRCATCGANVSVGGTGIKLNHAQRPDAESRTRARILRRVRGSSGAEGR
ncbi:hypothetical protein GGX14DRAFT_405637 [Mycena pura]|uniref:Uncharacterized protein n=1 Tax=Mycena pura TaxID=153505 RepID=A0AAD6URX4_9AGAR|nr:hypothetical protein GGX14DRAFT_405637 [Mycena pura]